MTKRENGTTGRKIIARKIFQDLQELKLTMKVTINEVPSSIF